MKDNPSGHDVCDEDGNCYVNGRKTTVAGSLRDTPPARQRFLAISGGGGYYSAPDTLDDPRSEGISWTKSVIKSPTGGITWGLMVIATLSEIMKNFSSPRIENNLFVAVEGVYIEDYCYLTSLTFMNLDNEVKRAYDIQIRIFTPNEITGKAIIFSRSDFYKEDLGVLANFVQLPKGVYKVEFSQSIRFEKKPSCCDHG